MILRFRPKGLARLYEEGSIRGIPAQHAARLRRILTMLEEATSPSDLRAPGLKLHPLKGDRRGHWAVWVSGNWRITFAFDGTNATDVDLVDYH
jgi:proteic killer suppression protein